MTTRVEKKPSTTKRMLWMILGVVLLIALIVGIKALLIVRMIHGMPKPAPFTVSTTTASEQPWQPSLSAVGTLRAARGADLAMDVAGLVTGVNLTSGQDVKQGQVLVQLRDGDDVAQLQQLEAAAQLSQLTFERARKQLAVQAISKADYDTAAADLKAKQAAVAQQQVVVAKKQLRAPFAGRAGIITVSPGAYLSAGTTIVTVQQLDPLFVDFYVPQSELGRLQVGQVVNMKLDAYAGRSFSGKLNAINPKVDPGTRNVQVEATVPNHDKALTPGMFAKVSVDAGSQQRQLTLPQAAIVYNPYGDTVYVVQPSKGKDDKGQPLPSTVKQTFVTVGDTRGDQVAIVKGIEAGTVVVTSGQIKLKNDAPIAIDNSVQPADSAHPAPQEN
ncbi:MexH family multidrug efflux RND transporter periplasmic adaptor subunit [Rhodanobacter panaciterrae]|uniref:MexH family multidrug efflux RND transporter periplasmic adaptor subunit n=1 Tax=Rhodanobacter panaciterrae TaxID=490572 RepID=A0ABQ3A453_9GAMM|nr:efflux RND transporter periplasmic adaptor subunit [Rhodanobacter panaciterrae]GGY31325.1 MexH family multidrug efflux RND transporter periplasmic adaptor subunit [Rhodanobacter panaciterrae]